MRPRRREKHNRAQWEVEHNKQGRAACVRACERGVSSTKPRVNGFVHSNSLVKWQPIPNTTCSSEFSSDTHTQSTESNTTRYRHIWTRTHLQAPDTAVWPSHARGFTFTLNNMQCLHTHVKQGSNVWVTTFTQALERRNLKYIHYTCMHAAVSYMKL